MSNKSFFFVILLILFLLFIFTLQGCTSNISNYDNSQLKDKDFTIGCYVIEGIVGFDNYFNTTKINTKVCKLKCSKELPKHFYYEYENSRTGCTINVGDFE